jgi:succinate dehydrogenase/fumarate reductase cytochrome b subunit
MDEFADLEAELRSDQLSVDGVTAIDDEPTDWVFEFVWWGIILVILAFMIMGIWVLLTGTPCNDCDVGP